MWIWQPANLYSQAWSSFLGVYLGKSWIVVKYCNSCRGIRLNHWLRLKRFVTSVGRGGTSPLIQGSRQRERPMVFSCLSLPCAGSVPRELEATKERFWEKDELVMKIFHALSGLLQFFLDFDLSHLPISH